MRRAAPFLLLLVMLGVAPPSASGADRRGIVGVMVVKVDGSIDGTVDGYLRDAIATRRTTAQRS